MAGRIASALAVLAGLALVACETEPASQTGYFDATVHAKVGCVDTRGNDSGYDAQWRIAYRLVGASGAWTADPWHDYTCPDEQPPHYLAGSPFPETLTGLRQNREYEYRLEVQHASGAPGTFEWRDSAGAKNGTDYDRFTTDAFPTKTPRAAGTFRESQGINSRIVFTNTPFANLAKVKEAVAYLGIRHLRESYRTADAHANKFQDLAENHGVTFTFGLGRIDADDNNTCGPFEMDAILTSLRSRPSLWAKVKYIEGPNEVDHQGDDGGWIPGWDTCVKQFMAEQQQKVDGERPIVGPTLVCTHLSDECPDGDSFAKLGNIEQWNDYGNMHPYAGGLHPELRVLDDNIPNARRLTPTRPLFATETGFHTDLANQSPHAPVPENVQAPYVLRTFLEFFRRGVFHTDLYSIVDANSCSTIWKWGLYRCDWTPKPAAHAVHNMNLTVGDGAPALTPLPWRVDLAPADYRELVLRRSDGVYVVAAWRAASMWNRETRTPITPQPAAFVASAPDAQSIHYVKPTDSATEHPAPFEDGELTFILGGEPILFVIR